MKVAIVSTAEIAAAHNILSPDFWVRQRLLADWDARSAKDRAATVAHYKAERVKARNLRQQAEALLDHARMIEAGVVHLEIFVKREEVDRGKTRSPDPDT